MNDVFKEIKDENGKPVIRKYGASTTWMGKRIPRLDSRRNGGCPVLALGIKRGALKAMEDTFTTAANLRNFVNGKNIIQSMPIHLGVFKIEREKRRQNIRG